MIIRSEIQVIGIILGLVCLHLFLVADLLSGLEHHKPKQVWPTLWVRHLLNVTINQCLGNANENKHAKTKQTIWNHDKTFELAKQVACSKAILPPRLATMMTFGMTMSPLAWDLSCCNGSMLLNSL